ncbi:MAG: hypothetical protein M3R64_09985 [Pseudomonadota bacterium]|nr:hypothetical protein [Pseudomonadota bacterium]
MSTRISSFAAPLLLAACGTGEETADMGVLAKVEAQQRAVVEDDGRILCAHARQPLARRCTVDRTDDARGLILTLRHPDGAFHRVLVTHDGRGVVAADGASYALVSVVGAEGIEIALDGDRYRLPATIGQPAS